MKICSILFSVFATFITLLISPCCLSVCGGMKTKESQRMWREKVALCLIIVFLMSLTGLVTFGLSILLCKQAKYFTLVDDMTKKTHPYTFTTRGYIYDIDGLDLLSKSNSSKVRRMLKSESLDATSYFDKTSKNCPAHIPCYSDKGVEIDCIRISDIVVPKGCKIDNTMRAGYSWKSIKDDTLGRSVFDGYVLDFSNYLKSNEKSDDKIDLAIRRSIGTDGTMSFACLDRNIQKCLIEQFTIGQLETRSYGCIISDLIFLISLITIILVLLAKTIIAFGFGIFRRRRSDRNYIKEDDRDDSGMLYGDETLEGSGFVDTPANNDPQEPDVDILDTDNPDRFIKGDNESSIAQVSLNCLRQQSYLCVLVTCYSESEEGLRGTLDSIAATDYPDDHILLLIIADGAVKGKGNDKTTSEIVLGLLEIEETIQAEDPPPMAYMAVASEDKKQNKAKAYAGWYNKDLNRVPVIFISKIGCKWEQNEKKPGNRGKRDSQIIAMTVFSRALFDDRMTALEYDLFRKIHRLTGIFPDRYDLLAMVDADTVVEKKALRMMVRRMEEDRGVVGLCGETKITNKFSSWVTKIQVFEYYISHHMNKAFESVFGCVTCLPGCFSMYRIKVQREDGFWVPIMASPEIIDKYSKNEVKTLHEKNLLYLGEDRYMTTLLLKTFPKRRIVFEPKAICRTSVPESFFVLLSQRRRWINSTIHNLFELVLVPEMCGVFCFSMKFVIFLELIGTLVLPAAIAF
eukprot:GHVP01035086.1.p1 GENE.GHVP01035086.1~~GHVP01035086.1.p1  ORF type:complete len:742 (-),score=102.71 GHVP01035086.1:475-2700(-)